MFGRLLILFVTVPLIELYLLFKLNDYTGSALTTIGLIVFTGIVGAWLAKQQGLSTISKIQKATTEGRIPGKELVDGGMILVAAALLLTPGILTDAFGFSLLLPPCRAVYRMILKRYFPKPTVQFHSSFNATGFGGGQNPFDPNVVDGEAHPVANKQNSLEHESE